MLWWRADPLAILALLACALPVARRRYLLGAALVVAIALASPVGVLADGYLFSAHMLQHLLLVLVAPPLVLMGMSRQDAPGVLAPWRFPLSWGLGVGAMWLWHAPTLCNAASQSAVVHRVQEVTLLAMGAAFWWPVMRSKLQPLAAVVYLFTACVACTILGVVVTLSPVEVCSVYAHPVDRLGILPMLREGWGLTPARDQELGGLLMWLPACAVYGAAILAQLARWYGGAYQEKESA